MVGPDNGLLSLAWALDGGVRDAVSITAPEVLVHPVSPVLNARDVFSPAAAHLAAGTDLARLGDPMDPRALVAIDDADPEVGPGRVAGEVLDVDRFGNVRLNVRAADLDAAGLGPDAMLEIASTAAGSRARRVTTYGAGPGRRVRRPAGRVGLAVHHPLRGERGRPAARQRRRPGLGVRRRVDARCRRANRLAAEDASPAWAMTPIEIRKPARRWSDGISVPWPTGATAGNAFIHTWLKSSNSAASLSAQFAQTTLSSEVPAFSRTVVRFFMHWRACSLMPPRTSWPVSGSIGPIDDT